MKLVDISISKRLDPHGPSEWKRIHEESLVYEGLITSQSPWLVIKYTNQKFPFVNTSHSQDRDTGTVLIYFTIKSKTCTSSDFADLLKFVNLLGWYPSWYNTDYKKGNKFNQHDIVALLNTPNTEVLIQLEAKYDVEEIKQPAVLYHATPEKYVEKIQKIGLTPKSKAVDLIYPDRIYLAKDLHNLVDVLIPHMTEVKKIPKWAIFEVKNLANIIPRPMLFIDPLYPHGYYTLSNIPPKNLTLLGNHQ